MEHTNIEEVSRGKLLLKDYLFKVVAIIILISIVMLLLKIRGDIKQHYEAFDENPFLFGAKKYNIGLGEFTTLEGQKIYFNQEKMWIEGNNNNTFENINLSLWDNKTS